MKAKQDLRIILIIYLLIQIIMVVSLNHQIEFTLANISTNNFNNLSNHSSTSPSSNVKMNQELIAQYRKDLQEILNNKQHEHHQPCLCDYNLDQCDVECCCDLLDCTEMDLYSFSRCLPITTTNNDYDDCHYEMMSNGMDFFSENVLVDGARKQHNYYYYYKNGIKHSSPILCLAKDNAKPKYSSSLAEPNTFILNEKNEIGNVQFKHKFLWLVVDDDLAVDLVSDDDEDDEPEISVTGNSEQKNNLSFIMKSLVKYKSGYRTIGFRLVQTMTTVVNNNKNFSEPSFSPPILHYQYWKLPFSITFKQEQCNHLKHVQYLYDFYSKCLRNLWNLRKKCTNDKYLDYRTYFTSDRFFLYDTKADMDIQRYKLIPLQTKDNKTFAVPYFDIRTNVCRNVVTNVEYIIWHEGINGIKKAQVSMEQIDIPADAKFIQQTFNVTFVWTNNKNEKKPDKNQVTRFHKKTLGYQFGSKIPFYEWNKINKTNRRRIMVYKRLIGLYQDGNCKNKKLRSQSIDFGINKMNQCKLDLELTKIPKKTLCSTINDEIHKYFDNVLEANVSSVIINYDHHQDNNSTNDHDDHDEEWVKVFDLTELINQTNSGSSNGKLICPNITIGITYKFYFIRLDQQQKQFKIIGVEIRKQNINLAVKSTCQQQSNNETICKISYNNLPLLKTSVNFIDLSEPFVPEWAPAPSIKIELPSDFFYPFTPSTSIRHGFNSAITTSTANYHYGMIFLINFLIIFCFM